MEYATTSKNNNNNNKNKVEIIQIAIQQLIESKQSHLHNTDEHRQLLTSLISQLQALKADGVLDPPELAELKESPSCKSGQVETKGKDKSEDVVKELKNLEKQNKITHWLLSALIVLTVTCQLSEVSLLLKLKDGVSHPFRSFGNMFKGIIRPRPNEQEQSKIPLLDLPDMVINGEKEKRNDSGSSSCLLS